MVLRIDVILVVQIVFKETEVKVSNIGLANYETDRI